MEDSGIYLQQQIKVSKILELLFELTEMVKMVKRPQTTLFVYFVLKILVLYAVSGGKHFAIKISKKAMLT